jgi:hypothetical protein
MQCLGSPPARRPDKPLVTPIAIITVSPLVETLLEPHAALIGSDLPGYRNHILRVLTYTNHFLGGDEAHRTTIEAALAFHDIGLWVAKDLAYLAPSEHLARQTVRQRQLAVDVELMVALIHWHHKLTPYRGPNARVVNALRKADWVDATQGRLRKGLRAEQIRSVEAALPDLGFHDALMRLAGDLSGGRRWLGLLRVLRGVYRP